MTQQQLVSLDEIGDIAIAVDADHAYLERTGDTLAIGMMTVAMNKLRALYEQRIEADRAARDAEIGQLRQQLSEAWPLVPMKLGTHEIRKPNGELQGYMTLTPVRLSWLDALDNHFEIVWGRKYRLCRLADAAQTQEAAAPDAAQEGGE